MDIDLNDTVERLKEILENLEGIPKSQQRLIFEGKQVTEDNITLQAHGILNGSRIFLIVAIPHQRGYSGVSHEHRNETSS